MTRKELEKLAYPDNLSPKENRQRLAVRAKGCNFYGRLRQYYPKHVATFCSLQSNLIRYAGCDFSFTTEGLIDFILEIGDIPLDMTFPSIGRINHNKGYKKGNFRWEEMEENRLESALRNYIHEGCYGYRKNQELHAVLDTIPIGGKMGLDDIAEKSQYLSAYRKDGRANFSQLYRAIEVLPRFKIHGRTSKIRNEKYIERVY